MNDDNGEEIDNLLPLVLDAADKYQLKVVYNINISSGSKPLIKPKCILVLGQLWFNFFDPLQMVTNIDIDGGLEFIVFTFVSHAFFYCPWQVVFHIEPYKGRDDANMRENIKYIVERYVRCISFTSTYKI